MRLLVLISILTSFASSFAQNNTADSLRSIWLDENKLLEERFDAIEVFYSRFGNSHPQDVLNLSFYHYKLAADSASNPEKFVALNNRARAHYVKGLLDSSLSVLNEAALLAENIDDKKSQITLLGNIGSILREDDRPEEALGYYLRCRRILAHEEYPMIQADLYSNMSLLYFEVKERERAYAYADSARMFFELAKVPEERRNVWHIMASIQLDWGQSDSALFFCRKSIRSFLKQQNYFFLGDAYYMMAKIHQARSKVDSALFYLERSLEIERSIGNHEKITRDQVLKASILLNTDPQQALALRDSIESSLPYVSTNLMKVHAYELLYDLAKETGNSEKALAMNEMVLSYKDSLQLEEQKLAVIRKSMIDSFAVQLEEEKRVGQEQRAALERKQFRRTLGLVGAAVAVVGLLLLLMFRRRVIQNKEKQRLVDEINALKSASDLSNVNDNNNSTYLEGFRLDREQVQNAIGKELNETDWTVLGLLAEDPVTSNKQLAEKAFRSVDGIGSSLRRMYVYFDVKESKYKKISLILKAIRLSNPK